MASPFQPGGKIATNLFAASPAFTAAQALREKQDEEILLSSVSADDEQLLSSMTVTADKNLRALAAALAIEWANSGEHDYESLESLIVGAVNDDDGDVLSDDDEQDIDVLINAVSQFILDITDLSAKDLQTLFEEENDTLAEKAGEAIVDAISTESTDELIADYVEKQALLLSAVKKVVRDGKTVLIKKRTKKRRMSPAQKAALKKARKKANTSAARAQRKKSNRLRKSKGM